MQGFQYFADDLSGFGHFSYELLQMVQDDYARSPVLLFALRPSLVETPAQQASLLKACLRACHFHTHQCHRLPLLSARMP